MTILILLVLGLLSQSSGQLVSKGYCQLPESADDYQESKIVGDWYEAWRIDNDYQAGFECVTSEYAQHKNGYMTQHVNAFVRLAGVGQSWTGTYIPENSCPVNRYFLKFSPHSKDHGVTVVFPAADWDNWAILYGCVQHGEHKYEYGWVYVKDLDDYDERVIDQALNDVGLCLDDFIQVNHSDCP